MTTTPTPDLAMRMIDALATEAGISFSSHDRDVATLALREQFASSPELAAVRAAFIQTRDALVFHGDERTMAEDVERAEKGIAMLNALTGKTP